MDTYKVSAPGFDKEGNEGEFSILIHERDSEVIPDDEKRLMLAMAAESKGIALLPPTTVELVA